MDKEYLKKYYQLNRDIIKQRSKIRYELNKNEILEKSKIYVRKNKERITLYKHEYFQKNKKDIIERTKKYRKQYRKENKDKIHLYNKFRRNNSAWKIRCNLAVRIYKALKGINKSARTIELLGCSIEQLKSHLESKFTKGMSWKNYGKWHIDHIKPCASFDLNKASEQRKCFHYKNLQPLWAKDNIKKGARYVRA